MSYIDGLLDRKRDTIHVVERVNGNRVYKEYPTKYVFYSDDPRGAFRNIHGDPVARFQCQSYGKFVKELKRHAKNKVWEHDINPVFRCLAEYYKGQDAPKLHIALFDIEVDFHKELGYSPVEDPFNAITAISVYLDWIDKLVTLALVPPTMTLEQAEEEIKEFDNTFLFTSEVELLDTFIDLIDDADILSGWNSEGYDIPYIVNRIARLMHKEDTRRLCLWGVYPAKRVYNWYGSEKETYDLIGRVHLDYMQLYIKYTYHEMHSYSLDAIGEYELNERKVAYEGTLDDLYKNDFKKFIDYNRQDTALLNKLNRKLQFIDIANTLAHANSVLLATTMGSVQLIEQGIINYANDMGLVVPSKNHNKEETSAAAGAYVAKPKPGLHYYIGALDINSLYPSIIRALNMSPETLVGQVRQTMTENRVINFLKENKKNTPALAWENKFGSDEYLAIMNKEKGTEVTIDWESGESDVVSAYDAWRLLFDSNADLVLTANGTIFTTKTQGVIPGILSRWYSERIELQSKKEKCEKFKTGIRLTDENLITNLKALKPNEHVNTTNKFDPHVLETLLTNNDTVKITEYIQARGLAVMNGDMLTFSSPELAEYWVTYYDKLQLVKKILLNSCYGALLNPGCRFEDKRIGQSTTLSGRCVTKHMSAKVNELLTGEYDYIGQSILYGDTDSVLFSAWNVFESEISSGKMDWNKEICVELYDHLADAVNESFPEFMYRAFHCPTENGRIIKGGREYVGLRGLLVKKKRYGILIYDKEGTRLDVGGKSGKVKAMGFDSKRSDTPKIMQDFLNKLLLNVLDGQTQEQIIEQIKEFKESFRSLPAWEKGTPKRVNNLKSFTEKELKSGKANLPGHVRAAYNWNFLRKMYGDNYSLPITDGQKTVVCQLRPNPMKITSIGYPVDQTHLPSWFLELPFDEMGMEQTIVDKKIENLLGVLNWGISEQTQTINTFNQLFEFET